MEIQSTSENDYVASRLVWQDFWIGYSDQNTEGVWTWSNSGVTGSYTNWYQGQPDNFGSGEDCAEIWGHLGRKTWNDSPCGLKRWFVCEIGKHVCFVLFCFVGGLRLNIYIATEAHTNKRKPVPCRRTQFVHDAPKVSLFVCYVHGFLSADEAPIAKSSSE